jgi:sporadic carbohydrate cluster 2OG-Fe(II) oxygenase
MQAEAPAFVRPEETELGSAFVRNGYVIRPAEDRAALDRIRDRMAMLAAGHLGLPEPNDPGRFLNTIHEHVDVARLNDLRLAVIRSLNAEPWLRQCYFAIARAGIETIVGNELVMQRRVNLSIQLPNDDSSLLPVHADVWSGDSAFEVVLWIPFVDVYGTKTMFLLPPESDVPLQARMAEFNGRSAEDLYHEIEPKLHWMKIAYGEYLLFSQNLMHGNRINRERETRWSTNCRFKSIFSPYADKKLGEFFEPISLRAATRMGLNYRLPQGFEE